MKIFERDGKTNFVDGNNCFVGFDNGQWCCEDFGYLITNEIPTKDSDVDDFPKIETDGFNFDTEFFHEQEGHECGGLVTFRLVRGEEQIYLTIYNHHNGYYSHGFEFSVDGQIKKEGSL